MKRGRASSADRQARRRAVVLEKLRVVTGMRKERNSVFTEAHGVQTMMYHTMLWIISSK